METTTNLNKLNQFAPNTANLVLVKKSLIDSITTVSHFCTEQQTNEYCEALDLALCMMDKIISNSLTNETMIFETDQEE